VLQLQASPRAHNLLMQSLRLQNARLKKQTFGPRLEKMAREIEQLKLAIEGLQIARTEAEDGPLEETEAMATTDHKQGRPPL
jgi:transposase